MTQTHEPPIVTELMKGVTSCGLHDDNSTELFDVEEASEVMAEAAHLIAEMSDALRDCSAGLAYVRQHYGELAGVGFERALGKAEEALTKAGAA